MDDDADADDDDDAEYDDDDDDYCQSPSVFASWSQSLSVNGTHLSCGCVCHWKEVYEIYIYICLIVLQVYGCVHEHLHAHMRRSVIFIAQDRRPKALSERVPSDIRADGINHCLQESSGTQRCRGVCEMKVRRFLSEM